MLDRILRPRAEVAYTFLRVVSGLMFAFHGMQKVFGWHTDHQPPVGTSQWSGAVAYNRTLTLPSSMPTGT